MDQYSIKIADNDNFGGEKITDFIYWMQLRGWSQRTIETYRTNVRQFMDNFLNTNKLWGGSILVIKVGQLSAIIYNN
jgi:hypothetical protein